MPGMFQAPRGMAQSQLGSRMDSAPERAQQGLSRAYDAVSADRGSNMGGSLFDGNNDPARGLQQARTVASPNASFNRPSMDAVANMGQAAMNNPFVNGGMPQNFPQATFPGGFRGHPWFRG